MGKATMNQPFPPEGDNKNIKLWESFFQSSGESFCFRKYFKRARDLHKKAMNFPWFPVPLFWLDGRLALFWGVFYLQK